VKGVAFANAARRRHIITTKTEHHAVLSACEYLEAHFGFDVTFLDVDRFGIVDPRSVEQAIRSDTALITIMHANNETGTIEPIEEIGRIARREGIVFHSDAVQTVGKIPIDTATLGVGLLSLSGHKMYGPKGVGALYVAEGIDLHPLTHGGGHEHGLRAGTENVAGIVGLATAVDLCAADLERSGERLGQLGARLEAGILERVPEAHVNGHPTLRLPGTVNVSFGRVEGESVVLGLDMEGVAVSTGSACTTGALEPSHVLLAMGVPPSLAQSSVRFSLGRWNTQREVDRVLEILPAVVDRLRVISPFRAHQR
jgi:cysteine desulfurase